MADPVHVHGERGIEENYPAVVFLACPTDMLNPKFTAYLSKRGWNSVVCLATGDVNILDRIRGAKKIYFVISDCVVSSAYMDMVIKALCLTAGTSCDRFLLKLSNPKLPVMLEVLNQFPEDPGLQL